VEHYLNATHSASLWDSLRPEVQRFALEMEERLKENANLTGDEPGGLMGRAFADMENLRLALHPISPASPILDVLPEAADVAVSVMLVAEVALAESKRKGCLW
jgi:hypothetical protein